MRHIDMQNLDKHLYFKGAEQSRNRKLQRSPFGPADF